MPRGEHIEIPLTGGLDTSSAERHVEPPSLLVAENIDYDEMGRIRKRVGYKDLEASGLSAPYQWLHERAGALLTHAKGGTRIYNTVSGGFHPGPGFDERNYPTAKSRPVSGQGATTYADVTVGNGYQIFANLEGDDLYTVVVDSATDSAVWRHNFSSLSSAALAVRVLVTGTTAVVVYVEGTSLKSRSMDLTASPPNWSSATTVRSDVHAADKYLDAQAVNSTSFVLCYRTNSGSTVRTEVLETSGFISVANRTDTFAGTLRSISVYWSAAESNGITVIADSTNGVIAKHWNSLLTGTASSTVDAAVTDAYNVTACNGTVSGRIMVWYDENDASNIAHKVHYQEVTADETSGAPVGSKVSKNNVSIAGRPFVESSMQCIPVAFDNDDDSERMLFLLGNISGFLYVLGRAQYLTSNGLAGRSRVGGTEAIESSLYVMGSVLRTKIVADATVHTGSETMASAVEWDFRAAPRHVAVNYGRTVFAPGAIGHGTDLLDAVIQGYPHSPEVSLAATTGGSLTVSSVYTYAVVYQFVDNQGQVHWSVPSVLETVTLSGGQNAVTVTIRMPITNHSKALIFRGQADDASVLNLAGTASLSGITNPTFNHSDTASDASIAGNEILYTNGGAQLGRHAAPASKYAAVHDNRVWVISEDDGSIWPSHRRVDPEAVSFHPSLAIDGAVANRRPVALASLSDSRLAVLWENRIAIVHGSGPNAAGQGSTYTDPLPVVSSAFCDVPRSVASTSLGVVFQSSMLGIWLLDQAGQTQHISDPVADFETDTCVKSVQLEDQAEIAFVTVSGSDTRVLYWAYAQNKWSTQLISGKAAVSAVKYQGRLAILFADGDVWHAWARSDNRYDFGGTALSNGSYKAWQIETAWIKARGKQGQGWFHRIYALLERKSDAGLRVELAYNYKSTYEERADYTDAELSVAAADPLHVEIQPKTARIEAVKLKFLEQVDGSNVTSEGLALDSIRLELHRENVEYGGIIQSLKKGAATI